MDHGRVNMCLQRKALLEKEVRLSVSHDAALNGVDDLMIVSLIDPHGFGLAGFFKSVFFVELNGLSIGG